MKIRWTQKSIRFRITPSELTTLLGGDTVTEELRFPGGGTWRAALRATAGETGLRMREGCLILELSSDDRERLAEPAAEGVYFYPDGPDALRYFVEKDFPCIHPRAAMARETPTETFAAPLDFEARKAL